MPEFSYIALNDKGKRIKGKVEARDKDEVFVLLKENSYYPMEVTKVGALQKDVDLGFMQKVSSKDLGLFCRQFSNIINAGVTVLDALDILSKQTASKKLSTILVDMHESVKGGQSISESMHDHEGVFPPILINMIEAGELSGKLEASFEKMAIHFEKETKLKQSVKKAITYPVIVSVIATLVIVILLTYVVPKFTEMLIGMGGTLPFTTQILISTSSFLKHNWYILLGVIMISIFLIHYYKKTEHGRSLFAQMKLDIPIFGKISKKVVSARFTSTLSVMMASGIPLIKALEITSRIVDNYIVEKGIMNARDEVSQGADLSTPLRNLDIFPPMVNHMIKIGEQTGSLDDIMGKVSDYYDGEVETAVTQLTTMIEPIIIVVLAIVVSFIVLSIIQPMFSIYGSINA